MPERGKLNSGSTRQLNKKRIAGGPIKLSNRNVSKEGLKRKSGLGKQSEYQCGSVGMSITVSKKTIREKSAMPQIQQRNENHPKTKEIEGQKRKTIDQAPEKKQTTETIEKLKRKQESS